MKKRSSHDGLIYKVAISSTRDNTGNKKAKEALHTYQTFLENNLFNL